MTEPQPEGAPPPAVANDKEERAVRMVRELFELMGVGARVEVKPGADGGISMALFLAEELPGVAVGKRSHLVEAIQFLANKAVNRPGADRRWISIGVGAHPEPRPPPRPAPAGQPPSPPERSPREGQRPQGRPVAGGANGNSAEQERLLSVSPDPELGALGKLLAEKSARLGRFYAVAPMKAEDRQRLLLGTEGTAGVAVTVEGEGRNRRLLFSPHKPTPMPKKALPVYDDEEDAPDEGPGNG